jgi:transcriptional regulator with XRE-family HTH domain
VTKKGGASVFPNLDAEMARRKITRQSLADKIHKTPTTLSLKLNGKAPITLVECIEIKNAIDESLSVDYLFKTEE